MGSSHQVDKVLELQLWQQSFQWILRVDFLWGWQIWSLCCPIDSQESSPSPQFERINSLALSLLYSPTLTFVHDYWKDYGNPLQYSCLENPMDRGAWWAIVYGVSKSWTRLSNFTSSLHFTGKTIALTTWTVVSKGMVMSLLFNTLSRFVIVFLERSKHLLISWLQSQCAVIFGAWGNKICPWFYFFLF